MCVRALSNSGEQRRVNVYISQCYLQKPLSSLRQCYPGCRLTMPWTQRHQSAAALGRVRSCLGCELRQNPGPSCGTAARSERFQEPFGCSGHGTEPGLTKLTGSELAARGQRQIPHRAPTRTASNPLNQTWGGLLCNKPTWNKPVWNNSLETMLYYAGKHVMQQRIWHQRTRVFFYKIVDKLLSSATVKSPS